MAVPGDTFDTLVRNVWAPELYREHFLNDWFFNGSRFEMKQALGGDTISTPYEYTVSSNVGTFQYDDPMVEPLQSSQVRAYFNKQSFQEAARVFKTKLNYRQNGGYQVAFEAIQHELDLAMKTLRDKIVTTLIGQLEAQIDSTTAYSDASLSRTTYAALKSYEEATATALTLTHLEDLVEALMTHTTYGVNVSSESELLFLFPRNQLTNLSRLTGGGQYNESVIALQDGSPADAGRVFRTKSFEGIEIASVPDMTTTVILCVHKPNIVLHQTEPFEVEEKSEAAHTRLWKLTDGWNIEAKRPNNHAKLSGKTA